MSMSAISFKEEEEKSLKDIESNMKKE